MKLKKLLYLFLFTIIIGAMTITTANAAIKVTPTILELDANKVRGNYLTASFDVQGGKNETIRFKVYPEYFKISQEGTMDMLEKTEAPDSLIQHVRFVPNEFTLQNGRTQKVRLTVANLNKLPDGESRMVLMLEDVAAKEVTLPYANQNVTTKLIVKTRVGIPVYVDKGRYTKNVNFGDFKVERKNKELITTLKLISDGNSKVRYAGKAQIIRNKQLVDEYTMKNNVVGSKNVLFTKEEIPLDKITQNGDYTLRMILTYNDEKGKPKNIIKETIFTVDGLCNTEKPSDT